MRHLEFFLDETKLPIMKVTRTGLSFNQPCLNLLKYPHRVYFGIDKTEKLCGVMPVLTDNNTFRSYKFASNTSQSTVFIQSFALHTEIIQLIDLPMRRKGFRFIMSYQTEKKLLTTNLKNPIAD